MTTKELQVLQIPMPSNPLGKKSAGIFSNSLPQKPQMVRLFLAMITFRLSG